MSDASLSLLAEDGRSVKVVAGSQSLGPMLNMRLVQPDLLVDITGIDELRQVKEETDGVVIGACVTHSDIEDRRVPDVTGGALPSVAHGIAYRAVRNRGTIGGSLTHADPSADWISILAALGASVHAARPAGRTHDPRRGLHARRARGRSPTGRIARLSKGAAAQSLGALGLSQDLPQDRRIRPCDRSLRASIPSAAFAARSSARPSRVRSSIADARAIIGDGDPAHFDAQAADELASSAGMNDPLERQTHVVALRRAVERAAGRMSKVNLTVNGNALSAEVEPRTHLADLLRETHNLTGTHIGCEHGVCGACTLLVDGAPIRSCITFAVACENADVTTIEGLDEDEIARELRAAFTSSSRAAMRLLHARHDRLGARHRVAHGGAERA